MTTNKHIPARRRSDSGFSMIETVISLGLLTTSLLGLAGVFGTGMKMMTGSSGDVVTTQKASEAMESVFTARDTRKLTWSQICNVTGAAAATGGVFKDGPQPVKNPGLDGLVNTADDTGVETETLPGVDNLLGTPDDETLTLSAYTREIEIRDVSAGLRQIRVIVRYNDGGTIREFILVSFISTYA